MCKLPSIIPYILLDISLLKLVTCRQQTTICQSQAQLPEQLPRQHPRQLVGLHFQRLVTVALAWQVGQPRILNVTLSCQFFQFLGCFLVSAGELDARMHVCVRVRACVRACVCVCVCVFYMLLHERVKTYIML